VCVLIYSTDKEDADMTLEATRRYLNENQETRFTEPANEIESITTIEYVQRFVNENTKFLEIGCGCGFYSLYFAKIAQKVIGIDLMQHHIDIFNQRISEKKLHNNTIAICGDALDLSCLEGNSFDVVCSFGPWYHLNKQDRKKSLEQIIGLCKANGIIVIAYINPIPTFIRRSIYRQNFMNADSIDMMIRKCKDPDNVFTFCTPSEIEKVVSEYGLEILHNIGADGNVGHLKDFYNGLSIDDRKVWMDFHFATCEEPSILGMSLHAFIICKKVGSVG
jgi:SAM-dependent methyltransferase